MVRAEVRVAVCRTQSSLERACCYCVCCRSFPTSSVVISYRVIHCTVHCHCVDVASRLRAEERSSKVHQDKYGMDNTSCPLSIIVISCQQFTLLEMLFPGIHIKAVAHHGDGDRQIQKAILIVDNHGKIALWRQKRHPFLEGNPHDVAYRVITNDAVDEGTKKWRKAYWILQYVKLKLVSMLELRFGCSRKSARSWIVHSYKECVCLFLWLRQYSSHMRSRASTLDCFACVWSYVTFTIEPLL